MRRLVLWDVDGTLVRAGPIGRDVFYLAVEQALGRRPDDDVVMSGKTDPQIALEILGALALAEEEARQHLPAVLDGLERQLADAAHLIREHGEVLPGASEVLARLHDDDEVVQTVLTGNLAANAVVKLGAFHLDRWLDLEIGAYGSDDHDRRRLVPVAVDRAEKRYGRRFDPEEVWVVGDTPRDLECARAGGARCLLVGTGRYALDELSACAPDAVVADLSDVEAVVSLLRA